MPGGDLLGLVEEGWGFWLRLVGFGSLFCFVCCCFPGSHKHPESGDVGLLWEDYWTRTLPCWRLLSPVLSGNLSTSEKSKESGVEAGDSLPEVWGRGIGFEWVTRANSFCGTSSFFWMEVTGNEFLIPALRTKLIACLLIIWFSTWGNS